MFGAATLENTSHSYTLPRNTANDFFLLDEIEQAIRSKGYQGLSNVEISVFYGVAFLRGRVSSFHMKQVAQTAARVVPGVYEIRNELNVVCPQ